MDAVEVLNWLKKYNHREDDDSTMMDVFSEDCACAVIVRYTSQEIVSRIERYEAEHNATDKNVESMEQEFKVGDVVKLKTDNLLLGRIVSITEYEDGNSVADFECYPFPLSVKVIEHIGTSREEKQKIEKINLSFDGVWSTSDQLLKLCGKINELVDAVNELRGV